MNEQALLAAIGAMMDEKLEAGLNPIRADIAEMKGDIVEMKADIVEMKADIKDLQRRMVKVEVRLENDVQKSLQLLEEGHESICQMVNGRVPSRERQEKNEARIFALEQASKQHAAQIAELQARTG